MVRSEEQLQARALSPHAQPNSAFSLGGAGARLFACLLEPTSNEGLNLQNLQKFPEIPRILWPGAFQKSVDNTFLEDPRNLGEGHAA